MRILKSAGLISGILMLLVVADAEAQITATDVERAIRRGRDYLKEQQNKEIGSWPGFQTYPGGLTALCTLALISAGEPVDSPTIQRALRHLRSLDTPEKVYSTALQTMVFAIAEPQKDRLLIERNVRWLESIQIKSGDRKGAWAYGTPNPHTGILGRGDNSNTQFAMLALHEAERAGVKINQQTWRLALDYWLRIQRPDGSWNYTEGQPSTGSMTSAGIASVVIASGQVGATEARVQGNTVICCGQKPEEDAVERGLQWLGRHFTVDTNPVGIRLVNPAVTRSYLLYYLYGVERVGRLTGRRFIGDHDWYREGAESLVTAQDSLAGYWRGVGSSEDNPLVATSFALLFLSKGKRQVVIGRLKYGDTDDWNRHQDAIHNLTQAIERAWGRELSWQTVDLDAASVEDLMQTPILFISGRQELNLTNRQKENLRQYVQEGGFIFAEACHGSGCDGSAFDASFRELADELFESPLRRLPPDHAVWFAERRFNPEHLPDDMWLYGIEACCRTSVVYVPRTLTCYWELAHPDRAETSYPDAVQQTIEACVTVGLNVAAYATNRELRDKLDQPELMSRQASDQPLGRGRMTLPKLNHGGGADDAPHAVANLLSILEQKVNLPVANSQQLLPATDSTLHDHPVLFMHGRRQFQFRDEERQALREYFQRGGFLLADSICASSEFADAFRREMQAIFPEQSLVRIPTSHPLFTDQFQGFDLSQVTLRDPQLRGESDRLDARLSRVSPYMEGIELDGRLVVVFSPYDISCALENHGSLECKGYVTDDAARLAINIVLFALLQ